MFKALHVRLRQGARTLPYPRQAPVLADRFRGRPVIDAAKCPGGCKACAEACPSRAIKLQENNVLIDLGQCLFCTDCFDACPLGAITYSRDHRLAVRKREDLLWDGETVRLAQALDAKMKKLLGRSLKLRQVCAGGCNGCEVEVNVLQTIVFDLGRFGIQMVASPRHADGLLITGPVTEHMRVALKKTYDAVPSPKIVIAAGACAVSGGLYRDHPEQHNGADPLVPVDLYIPGCPPHPITILDGLLRLLGKIEATVK